MKKDNYEPTIDCPCNNCTRRSFGGHKLGECVGCKYQVMFAVKAYSS